MSVTCLNGDSQVDDRVMYSVFIIMSPHWVWSNYRWFQFVFTPVKSPFETPVATQYFASPSLNPRGSKELYLLILSINMYCVFINVSPIAFSPFTDGSVLSLGQDRAFFWYTYLQMYQFIAGLDLSLERDSQSCQYRLQVALVPYT